MRNLTIFSTAEEKVFSSKIDGDSIYRCVNNYILSHNWGNIKVQHTHWNVIQTTFPNGNIEYLIFSDLKQDTKNYQTQTGARHFCVFDSEFNSEREEDLFGKSVAECVTNIDYAPEYRCTHIFENIVKFTSKDGSKSYQIFTPMGSRWDIA